MTESASSARGQLGPHAGPGRLSAGPGFPVPGSQTPTPRPRRWRPRSSANSRIRQAAARAGAPLRGLTFDWENISVRGAARALANSGTRIAPPLRGAGDRAGPARGEALFARLRHPHRRATRRWTAARTLAARAVRAIGLPGVLKTRRLGYDGKGQAVLRHRPTTCRAPGQSLGGAAAASTRSSCPSTARSRCIGVRSTRGDVRTIRLTATSTATASCG